MKRLILAFILAGSLASAQDTEISVTTAGGGGGSGDVTGPASSTDNAIARFDGTTGKIIQNSGSLVDDSGNILAPDGALTAPSHSFINNTDMGMTFFSTGLFLQNQTSATSPGRAYLRLDTEAFTLQTYEGADSNKRVFFEARDAGAGNMEFIQQVYSAVSTYTGWLQQPQATTWNFNTAAGGEKDIFQLGTGGITLCDQADDTKCINFVLSGITTGTTRTWTAPDANISVLGNAGTGITLSGGSILVDTSVITQYTSGTATPSASCNPGELYHETDINVLWGCNSTNTWTANLTPASTATLTNKTFDANGTGNSLSNVDVADLANGTDGQLITWDAAGAPAVVATGTATQVLTSNGPGTAPTFQAAAGGGAPTGAEYIVGSADATLTNERVTTDTTTLEWDKGTAAQLKANVLGFVRPHVKRTTYCAIGFGPETFKCIGAGDYNATGTRVDTVATATEYSMVGRQTAATTANQARVNVNEDSFFFNARNLHVEWRSCLSATTTVRNWQGLADSPGTIAGSDDPVDDVAAFRYSTSATDTNFQCYTNDGTSTGTVTDTGIAADTSCHTFTIIETNSTNYAFYIDGALECTHTTNLPSSVGTTFTITTTTLDNVARRTDYAYWWIEEDAP